MLVSHVKVEWKCGCKQLSGQVVGVGLLENTANSAHPAGTRARAWPELSNIRFRIKQSKEGLKEKPYNLSYQAAAFAQEKILQGLIREFSEDLTFLQESILDNPINYSGKFVSVPFLYHHPEQYKKTSVNRFWNQLHQLPFKANSSMIQSHIK